MRQFRQGDLLFEEVRSIPAPADRNASPVLAYGEVTGHSHTVVGAFDRFDASGDIYLRTNGPCEVVHEEHGAIALAPEITYRVVRQREHDPLTSIPKPVID